MTIGTSQPRELARFHARLLGRPVTEEQGQEPGEQNASQHLDLNVGDLPAAVAWALACGSVQAGFQPQDDVRVMLDTDGHPFCLSL
ncbi:VOC family protein [Nonomuraea sp. NPDC002799]